MRHICSINTLSVRLSLKIPKCHVLHNNLRCIISSTRNNTYSFMTLENFWFVKYDDALEQKLHLIYEYFQLKFLSKCFTRTNDSGCIATKINNNLLWFNNSFRITTWLLTLLVVCFALIHEYCDRQFIVDSECQIWEAILFTSRIFARGLLMWRCETIFVFKFLFYRMSWPGFRSA